MKITEIQAELSALGLDAWLLYDFRDRILYRIDDENYRVKIYRIKHRGRAYR